MAKVDFILVGSMKSGTTTFIDYLKRHPGVYIPKFKEPQYFSRDEKYNRGVTWYESLFDNSGKDQICGEASTCYTRWPKYSHVAERIYNYSSRVKLIYIVRHPVERAYSQFRHSYVLGEWKYDSFREALKNENEIIDSSKYMMQLRQYLEYFPRNQILILRFEDLVNLNSKIFEESFEFLNLPWHDVIGVGELKSNTAGFSRTKNRSILFIRNLGRKTQISKIIKSVTTVKQREKFLYAFTHKLINSHFGKFLVANRISVIPELEKRDREYILSECENDLTEFEKFTGWDLSSWYI